MASKSVKPDGGNDGIADNAAVSNAGETIINGEQVINPGDIAGAGSDLARDDNGNTITNADGSLRKKRGRKPGQRYSGGSGGNSGTASARNTQAVNTLSKTLAILHMGIAGATKFDGFALADNEADALAASVANVMDQFDFAPDPRLMAVAGLVSTSATIYGPRIYLYREHLKDKAREKAKEKDEVIDWTLVNGGRANA